MAFFSVKGAEIHYQTWGNIDDPPLTLVNGYLRSYRDFHFVAKEFVKEGFRVISLDNRGSGSTKVSAPFELSDMASDIVSLWNHLKIDKSFLLGISMGGAICQYIAAHHEERINRLILVSTAPEESYITEGEGWLFSSEREVDELTKEKVRKKFEAYFSNQYAKKYPAMIKSIASEFLKSLRIEGQTKLAIEQKNAICGKNESYMPLQIKAQTLILHGGDDRIVDKKAAYDLHKSIEGSKVEICDDVGHLLLMECPKLLIRHVLDFLKRD